MLKVNVYFMYNIFNTFLINNGAVFLFDKNKPNKMSH